MINCNKALKLAAIGFDNHVKKELKKFKKYINRQIKFKCSMGLHYAHIHLDEYSYIKEDEIINTIIEKLKKKGYNVAYKEPYFISISWKEEGEKDE